jgi:hypothetical protein
MKVEAEVVHLTDEQRRERARQAILEAFAERPMQLIEGTVIEQESAETEASDNGVVGGAVGSDVQINANQLINRGK